MENPIVEYLDYQIPVTQLKGAKGNGDTGLSGFWALEWAWHIRVTNLRCEQDYGI